ncbi:MAG TPA: triphosphoribosyl-dephospho-CoA synthase [Steroidobacteraceae bacterium]|nr:triphosphoribosyl-dephospho-CoA synthase [Steroidobacteraceae bacterium]
MPVLSNVVRSTALNPTNGTAAAARRLARLARQALIAEAELTPKPGLVDRRGDGAHTDLSLDTMRRSAVAIEPYFCRMAILSKAERPSQSMREQLALIGRHAEHAMLEATGGSNSHKGAIWALGLLVSATAMYDEDGARAVAVAAKAKDIASFEDRAMPRLVSHGDAVARRYGFAGARGEALNGFPHVMEVALPMLRRRRLQGASEQVARLDALLSVMSRLDDTCVLYRGGEAALATAKAGAFAVETAGGSGTALGKQRLWQLDRRLLEMNVSPGGSADLLAAALLLDAVERRQTNVAADESVAELSQSPTEVSQSLTEISQSLAGTSQSLAGTSQSLTEVFHGTH